MGRAARRWVLGLSTFTLVGVVAGVQGFLSGAFAPLVDDLQDVLRLTGPVVPAVALAVLVGVPQLVVLMTALRRAAGAPTVAVLGGALLAGWVAAQLPLVGWTSPVQWAFAAVGLAECVAGLRWRRSRDGRVRAAGTTTGTARADRPRRS
ncbi:hypothetical protein OMK64_10575 [Cellulomonas fimi]|uniref:hypothetical protein n=1 Tax=Cellulomonas fimi TaxID=1708 RepID=UPI00234D6FEE|nr:hypothetical protein [Cellulomonas fimi]MDC7121981.1 hypothetical protein [Cellulomonas fimi]